MNYQTNIQTITSIEKIVDWKIWIESIQSSYSKYLFIIDENLSNFDEIKSIQYKVILKGGELNKSWKSLEKLLNEFQSYNLDRHSVVISIGGGSISDLAGFAASIYMRGLDYISIPTTLLSLIDAGIGGKNGINFNSNKNQIGTVYQPIKIAYFDLFLNTLQDKDLSDGFAEIIKYGVIMDDELLKRLSLHNIQSFKQDSEFRDWVIERCIDNKVKIISQDPLEKGIRKTLNFGHTIGHAIESLTEYSHGQSVALGTNYAMKISEIFYNKSTEDYITIHSLIKLFGLSFYNLGLNSNEILDKIKYDKKRKDDSIDFILCPEIGKSEIVNFSFSEFENLFYRVKEEIY